MGFEDHSLDFGNQRRHAFVGAQMLNELLRKVARPRICVGGPIDRRIEAPSHRIAVSPAKSDFRSAEVFSGTVKK